MKTEALRTRKASRSEHPEEGGCVCRRARGRVDVRALAESPVLSQIAVPFSFKGKGRTR